MDSQKYTFPIFRLLLSLGDLELSLVCNVKDDGVLHALKIHVGLKIFHSPFTALRYKAYVIELFRGGILSLSYLEDVRYHACVIIVFHAGISLKVRQVSV